MFNHDCKNYPKEEHLGAFSGYIRRPIPHQTGMIAQIFGENGDDADTILALSLSKYQDMNVFVNIYLIKDSSGKIIKKNNEYPLISSFVGLVRRSQPKKEGMIAQFFAPNGEAADSASLLSKSEYLDCLVFVDVRSQDFSQKTNEVNQENLLEIENNYIHKFTKQQKLDMDKKEKQYKKMNEQLQFNEFFYRLDVLTLLGTPDEYKKWILDTQPCSHAQEKNCLNNPHVIQFQELLSPYNLIPVCETHEPDLFNTAHLQQHQTYYEMKHRILIKQWAWKKMIEKFAPEGMKEPNPSQVIEWAIQHNINRFLPYKYQSV